jgi:hypothetical protein
MIAIIFEGIPGNDIEIIELTAKKDKSSRRIQTIWMKKPMNKLAEALDVNSNLPPLIRVAILYSILSWNCGGMIASASDFSGKIVLILFRRD